MREQRRVLEGQAVPYEVIAYPDTIHDALELAIDAVQRRHQGDGHQRDEGDQRDGRRDRDAAVRELGRYLGANVPVGEHLADQLLLPMAVARAGRFRTMALSSHATTNLDTIGRFLDVKVAVKPVVGGVTVTFGD